MDEDVHLLLCRYALSMIDNTSATQKPHCMIPKKAHEPSPLPPFSGSLDLPGHPSHLILSSLQQPLRDFVLLDDVDVCTPSR
jgi:hypothetical protein